MQSVSIKSNWPIAGARPSKAPQQKVLRDAMDTLGLTRKEFAARIHVPFRTLEKWLLPEDSGDYREMPDIARGYVADILQWHAIAPKERATA